MDRSRRDCGELRIEHGVVSVELSEEIIMPMARCGVEARSWLRA